MFGIISRKIANTLHKNLHKTFIFARISRVTLNKTDAAKNISVRDVENVETYILWSKFGESH